MNIDVLLTALGGASLPSVALEVVRTLRARSRDMREAEAQERRAPFADAQLIVSAARDATTVQQAVMAQLQAQLTSCRVYLAEANDDVERLHAEVDRLHADNDRLRELLRRAECRGGAESVIPGNDTPGQ